MQPCSREMQAMNSILSQNQSQISLQDLQNVQQMANNTSQIQQPHFDPSSSHDDFLEQMLTSLPSCSWPDFSAGGNQYQNFDDPPTMLASKFRQHQISGGGNGGAVKSLLLQQQLLSRGLGGGFRSPAGDSSGLLSVPLNPGGGGESYDRSQNDVVGASFKSLNQGGDGSIQALYNGFTGSLQTSNQSQHFHHSQGGAMQAQNFGATAVMNQAPACGGGSGSGVPSQPRQRVRARRGQATDPHSIAERLRRERIAERMKALQELVPNANKTDKASMLDEIIDYVKFLQLQVKVLSMSRLGGAAAVAPLVADISSERGGDCLQTSGGVGLGRGSNGTQTAASSSNDSMTVTEHQVAKLMEEDMGSAMQYLQGKGLCLMPISLATAISTATGRTHQHHKAANNPLLFHPNGGEGGGPSSPSISVLTVQSATTTMGNGINEASVKDATSVSKP
ncbi:hypothetical protein LguiA_011119 [Lonicera macranthoides]